MTSVRNTPAVPPQRTEVPRCHCGIPITHTLGKRPRVYCSDACRKAAKRAIVRTLQAADGKSGHLGTLQAADGKSGHLGTLQAADGKSGHLGKETTEFPNTFRPAKTSVGAKTDTDPEAARKRASRKRRTRRYADRRTLWKISGNRSCRGCGRTLMDPESGVILAQTAQGNAVALGLLRCGKIWFCPVCSAKIRHGRAEEITPASVSWMARGGTAVLVTFTVRHAAAHKLAALMDAIQGTRVDKGKGVTRKPGAYQRLITGGTWAGRPERGEDGIRDRVGYIGMIRATEVTVGHKGWHPHIHAIVFLGGRTEGERGDKRVTKVFTPSESAMAELEDHFRAVWTGHLAKVDPEFKPSDAHGVDFKLLKTARDAENFGQYVAKLQDGDKSVSPANELVRGDLKDGRFGNMTPFKVLGRIGDLMGGVLEEDVDGHGDLSWCLAKWAEYEAAVTGRRAIEWTRYLRPLLGVNGGDSEEDDMDLLFTEDGASDIRAGVHMQGETWHKVTGRALDLAATEAVEGRGLDLDAVTEVVTLAGAAVSSVRLLSPGEVAEAWEATLAKLAERREQAAIRRQVERSTTRND